MTLTEILQSFGLNPLGWATLALCALMVGMTKVGIQGLGMIVIPVMASLFDPKLSVGILLPMLITGDIVAARHYHRSADWKHLFLLLPWVLGGILVGVYVGNSLETRFFKYLISFAIILGIIPLFSRKKKAADDGVRYPESWWFSAVFGILSGFFTMVGNASGPLMSIYLLSMNLPKNSFIGTSAWFFLIVNLIKVPFHVLVWGTINPQTLLIDLIAVPPILIGAYLGIKIVGKFNEKFFRYLVIGVTIAASLRLFF